MNSLEQGEGGTREDGVVCCEICGGPCQEENIAARSVLLRCPRCDHIIRDLRRCPADARRRCYGGSEQFDRFRLFFTQRRLVRLLTSLPGDRPLHVLEVGFGNGRLLKFFQDRGHRVYGVEVCHSRNADLAELIAGGAQLFFDGLERARLPAETMDLIYLVHVVEHLPDPLGGFRKLAQWARPGAQLYLITPNGRSAGLRVFGDRWWHLEDPTHRRFFTPGSLQAILGESGFQILTTRAPLLDSLSLEINSLLRCFHLRGAVMDHALARWLDLLLMPAALLMRWLWPSIRPNVEVLAQRIQTSRTERRR